MTNNRRKTQINGEFASAGIDKLQMSDEIFDRFRKIVYTHSGITLGDNKKSLVKSRIAKRLRVLGFEDCNKYLKYVDSDHSGNEIVNLLDVISTNVTSFFREPKSFEAFNELFIKWLRQGQRKFRFWSSASSTGEEPYTMAMIIREALNSENISPSSVDIKILATDISTTVLQNCARGTFRDDKIDGIPPHLLLKYFHKHQDEEGFYFLANNDLKSMLVPRLMNLSVVPFPMNGPMDVVFCRNVMIYFDKRVKLALIAEIHRLLKPSGLLIVGNAESLTGLINKEFKSLQPSIYLKQ